MLWQFQGSNSFLYGSVHASDLQPPRLPRPLEQAFAQVQRVVLEADIRRSPARSQMRLPGSTKLSEVISPDLFRRTRRYWFKLLPLAGLLWIDLLRKGAPGIVALWLISAQVARMGYLPALGTEHQIIKRRAPGGKQLAFLETISGQVDVVRLAPLGEQVAFLQHTVDQIDAGYPEMGELIAAWKRDDMTQLLQIAEKDTARFPAFYKALLHDRNQAWIPTIEEYARSQVPTLFVAGALHMVGPTGVVALLQERGFQFQAHPTPVT
jgi:uncharacterized protein YbaP (TraB family)